jgi:hypothetical protein
MLATLEPIADAEEAAASAPPAEIGLFQDIPSWIWAIFLGAWAMFFGLMILFFATSAEAAFVVTIVALFGLMAFGLPLALGAQSKCGEHDCKGVVHTLTGPLSARAASAQIALIPVAVVIGLAGFIMLAM